MQCIKEYKLNHVICISARLLKTISTLSHPFGFLSDAPESIKYEWKANKKWPDTSSNFILYVSQYFWKLRDLTEHERMRMGISQFYLWFGASNFPPKKSIPQNSTISYFCMHTIQRFAFLYFLCSIPSIITRKDVNMNYKRNGCEKKCKLGWEVVHPTRWTAKMNDWMHCGEWSRKSTSSRGWRGKLILVQPLLQVLPEVE